MIVATAGHVDHGKTALIRQLTGVETDRLAEEQRRGLSINLGYAYLPCAKGVPLGFIDVPGHTRFINNMIAGISGIDIGMLVIAADDGPMPQTHEHLDVLQLLGVKDLLVVISKIDRVAIERVAEVKDQVQATLATRPWSNTEIFPVSNIKGDGIERLKTELLRRARAITSSTTSGYFRQSIDRTFTAKGVGLIVTGTASAGTVQVGDSLVLLPQNVELRVRDIRVHDEKAEQALAGQRCALNVTGKPGAVEISRGDWLVQHGAAAASNRLDVHFTLLENAPFPVKHLSPIKMYIGAKRVAGRLAILDKDHQGKRLLPGANCLAQLILEGEVACFHGERFLLRDHAENVILGGGTILDPNGPHSGKSRPERIACLNAMKEESPAAALAQMITREQLVNLDRFRQAWNVRKDESLDLRSVDLRQFSTDGDNWAVSLSRWNEADRLLCTLLDNWHREQPQQSGIKVTDLKSALVQSCEPPLLMAVLTSLLHSGELNLSEGRIRRASFQPAVSAEAAAHWQQFHQLLQRRGKHIPLLSQVSTETGIPMQTLEQLARNAVKRGELHSITNKRYALPAQLLELANAVLSCATEGQAITVITLKSHFDAGRKLTIEILEYFDSIHFTRREDDVRVILDPELPAQLFNR